MKKWVIHSIARQKHFLGGGEILKNVWQLKFKGPILDRKIDK